MEVLFVLGIVLVIVTIVGHAIWEGLAFALRGFQRRQARAAGTLCPACRSLIDDLPCRHCGFSLAQLNERAITRAMLQKVVSAGHLDADTCQSVFNALDAFADPAARLRPPPLWPPTVVAPSPVAETVPPAPAAHPPAPPSGPHEPDFAEPRPLEIPLAHTVDAADAAEVAKLVDAAGVAPYKPLSHRLSVPPHARSRVPQSTQSPPPAPLPPAPPPPRKPLSVLLKAFLEEKNIRWGELIGGLLIVGCSLALVLSLWAQISERPFLKVGVFTAIVAGLFGLGLYAQRKWKLPTTSRGILTTAMLMVPLHFAAMVVIGGQEQSEPLVLLVQAASAIALAFLAYLAADVIAPRTRLLLTAGLLVLSLSGPMLYLTGQLADAAAPHLLATPRLLATLILIVGLSLAFGALAARSIARAATRVATATATLDATAARESLVLLGVLLFAALPSIAIHAFTYQNVAVYWQLAAPVLATLLFPALAGLFILRGQITERGWDAGLWSGTVALTVASFLWVGVAWPMPAAMLACALFTGAATFAIAWRFRQSYHLLASGILLLVAYAVGVALFFARVAPADAGADLVRAILVPRLGLEAVPALALLAALGFAVLRRDKLGGILLAGLGALVGGLGLLHLIATVYATDDVVPGAWIAFLLYGLAAVAAGALTNLRPVSAIGSVLLLLAGERLLGGGTRGLMLAALVLASLNALATLLLRFLKRDDLLTIARDTVIGAAILAIGLVAWRIHLQPIQHSALYTAWSAAALLLLLLARPGMVELALFQLALSAAAVLQAQVFADSTRPMPIVLHGATALLVLQLLWSVARHLATRVTHLARVFNEALPVDRVLGALAAAAIGVIAFLVLQDAATWELDLGARHTDIGVTAATPLLWAALALAIIVGIVEAFASGATWLLQSAAALFALAWVLAVRAWPEMGASAMRFSSAAVLLSTFITGWSTSRLTPAKLTPSLRLQLRNLVLLIGGAVIVLLTVLAAGADLAGTGPRVPAPDSLFARLGPALAYLIPLGALIVVLAIEAVRARSATLATLACLTVNLAVTLGYILEAGVHGPSDLVALFQVNAIAAGACAWIWLLLRATAAPSDAGVPLTVRLLGAYVGVVALLGALATQVALLGDGRPSRVIVAMFGGYLTWIVAALAISFWWHLWRQRMPAFGIAATIVLLFSTAAAAIPTPMIFDWMFGYHLVLLGHVAGVWIMYFGVVALAERGLLGQAESGLGVRHAADDELDADGRVQLTYALQSSDEQAGLDAEHRARLLSRARVWGVLLALAASLFALGAMVHHDPHAPWWTVGAFIALGALGIVVAQLELRPNYLYPATVCACLAVTFVAGYFDVRGPQAILLLNTAVVAVMGIISVILEHQRFAPALGPSHRRLHVPAAWLSIAVLLPLSVFQSAVQDYAWTASVDLIALTLAAAGATVALAVACLWIPSMTAAPVLLYLASFAGLAMLLDLGAFTRHQVLQVWLIAAVGLCALWGVTLRRWDELAAFAGRFGAHLPLPTGLPQFNAALALCAMLAMLLHEAFLTAQHGYAPMDPWLIVVFAALLVLVIVSLISTALGAIRDPLLLPFRQREMYVYAAQIVAALLFVHIRLTCPQLFTGFFTQVWPLVLLVIAFAALGAGHLLARRGVQVLSGPILNGSLALALVPALFAEMHPSRVDYAWVLLAACAFYATTAAVQRSAIAAILAILAANGAIWAFLWDRPALHFATHPQLWLVPPALSVIVASYFTRERFTAAQLTAIRYAALAVIYLASTLDIFLVGVAHAPWLIGVLALLSVLGAMAGILLRIRSFLYLGTAFLVVSIVTLIYHATANLHQTWLMWLAGIALGVGIILLFAAFEKRKDQIERLIAQLQSWDD